MAAPCPNQPPGAPAAGSRCRPAACLATGLGVGWVRWAPGTVGGAVWGLPLAYLIGQFPPPARIVAILCVCGAGVPICSAACRSLGGRKDPGAIVLDEIASMPMTFFLVPMSSLAVVLAGFALNRVLDIVKPPPARQLENLPAGLGVMADDWAAGVYSCLALHLLVWLHVFPAAGG